MRVYRVLTDPLTPFAMLQATLAMSLAVASRWIAAATGAAVIAALAIALPGHADTRVDDVAATSEPALHSAVQLHKEKSPAHARRLRPKCSTWCPSCARIRASAVRSLSMIVSMA